MNASTKNSIIIGVLVLSVAVNLAIVGTMWFYKPKPEQNVPGQNEIKRPSTNHSQVIANNLNFNKEQEDRFNKMRAGYTEQTRNNKIALKNHYNKIMDELKQEEPQRQLLDSLAKEVGKLHEEQQQSTINHFIALREVCSPEQYDQLQRMFSKGMKNGQRRLELEQRRLHKNRFNNRRNRRINE